jgi:hypothetical protein
MTRAKSVRLLAALSVATAVGASLASARLRAEPAARVVPITAKRFASTRRRSR